MLTSFSSLMAIVIKGLMIWELKCHQNNSPVVCDGYVKYEEAEVDRLVAILKTNNCGGGCGGGGGGGGLCGIQSAALLHLVQGWAGKMSPIATNGALNGHFLIFTLQIFCFCRHMWRCGDHLPTSVVIPQIYIMQKLLFCRGGKIKTLQNLSCLLQYRSGTAVHCVG